MRDIRLITVAPRKQCTAHNKLTTTDASSPHTTLSQSAIFAACTAVGLRVIVSSALSAAAAIVAGGITFGAIFAVL